MARLKISALLLCMTLFLYGCTDPHHESHKTERVNLKELSGIVAVQVNDLTMELEMGKEAVGITQLTVLSPPEISGLSASVTEESIDLKYEGLEYTVPKSKGDMICFAKLSAVLDSLLNHVPEDFQGYNEAESLISSTAGNIAYTAFFNDEGRLYKLVID